MKNDSEILLHRIRNGDEEASQEAFERYADQLLGLVRSRLPTKLGRRIDPEDVLQSAYRSFFVRAQDGHYKLRRAGDLGRLLAAITMNKLGRQIERHSAEKRNISRERDLNTGDSSSAPAPIQALAEEPTSGGGGDCSRGGPIVDEGPEHLAAADPRDADCWVHDR